MRLVFSALMVLILFSQPVLGLTIVEEKVLEDPAGVSELTVDIHIYGTVNVDGNPTWIGMNLTIPQEDDYQDVTMDIDRVANGYGTVFGAVEDDNPGNSYSYSFEARVKSRAIRKTTLPGTYAIPDDVKVYMEPSENIQSDDPRFRELAESIVEDSGDDFDKIGRLAVWVNDYLTYDLDYSDRNYDALWVLDSKKGVCAEYTTLYMALARSLGIPTRFVSAWAYGKYGWERHAYAESYIGKWVPVDVLWMEIGYIDATHIRFGYYQDNKIKNSVNFRGFGINDITWSLDETSLSISDYDMREKREDYELVGSSDKFRPGDEGIVVLKFTPSDYRVARIDLEPCTGNFEILDIGETRKTVTLRPGEQQVIYWKFGINEDLPSNYLYTCPMTLNSKSLALRSINLEIDPSLGGRTTKRLNANLRSGTIKLGQEQSVYVSAIASGLTTVGVASEKDIMTWDITRSRDLSHTFVPESLGEQEVVVFSSEGEVITLPYSVKSDLMVQIKDFGVPMYLKLGDTGEVSALIENSGLSEKHLRVDLKTNGEEEIEHITLEDTHRISKDISFSYPGQKEVSLSVENGDIELLEIAYVNVFREPELTYDVKYSSETGIGTLIFEVRNSDIRNVSVTVGDQEKGYAEMSGKNEVEFILEKGEYEVEVGYRDLAGNSYLAEEKVVFQDPGIFETIFRMLNDLIESIMGMFSG